MITQPYPRQSTPHWTRRLFGGHLPSGTGSRGAGPAPGIDDALLGYESALPYLVRSLTADAEAAPQRPIALPV